MGCKNRAVFIFVLAAGAFLALAPAEAKKAAEAPAKTSPAATSIDIFQAMAAAYGTNPELEAARAELRGVDELHAQSAAGFRPSVTGVADYASSRTEGDAVTTHADVRSLKVELTQPLYRGGSTMANVRKSDSRIKAQRAKLRSIEQRILLEAATAYMDVTHDRELLRLHTNNEKALEKHLAAAKERFRLGKATKTDVSQATARLAEATAGKVAAKGALKKSRAVFEKVTGLSAEGATKQPGAKVGIPGSLDQALEEAEKANPDLAYAVYTGEAAGAAARSIAGELLPRVDLRGSVGRTYDPVSGFDDREDETAIGLRATIPIFGGGGETWSKVREARHVEAQRRMETDSVRNTLRQKVIAAWEDLESAEAEGRARAAQDKASGLALTGVKAEAGYGSRTTLDVLDAEQEAMAARIASADAERNKVVARFSLLAATGGLTAEALKLDTVIYNPIKNFQNVKNRWAGAGIR